MGKPILISALCAALALAGNGCGGSSSSAPSAAKENESNEVTAEATIPGKAKPTVQAPNGPPPKKLVVKDLEVGAGPEAKAGDSVYVQYVGIHWTGTPYSDTWTYPVAPVYKLGSHRLMPGLDTGIRGMKKGGRRELEIPPQLTYYPDEEHPKLGPEDAAVFVVDLVEIY